MKTEYTGSGVALSQLMDFKNNVNLTAEYFYDKNANQIKDCNKIVSVVVAFDCDKTETNI